MADGWRCPECALILAPDVREHRCEPPPGGVAALPVTGGGGGGGGGAYAWPEGSGICVTGGSYSNSTGTWSSGSGGFTPPPGVTSVRVTAANACDAYGTCGHAGCAVIARTPLSLVTGHAA